MAKEQLSGFAAETDFVPLPDIFFTQVMPQIHDSDELKVMIYIFYLLHHMQGHPRFITYEELFSHSALISVKEEVIRRALNSAVERGVILGLTLNINGKWQEACLINTESNKRAIGDIERGEFPLGRAIPQKERKPNVFALYEQNIGVITPMVAEELKEAEKLYPFQWIEAAFKEAVVMNKRNWKYIARILERWANEGKDSGEYRQDTKKSGPNKYITGKYGHLVKR